MSAPEMVKYDAKSLLVVNDKGLIRQLFTPFKVQCIEPVESIPALSFVFVDAVLMHKKYVLLYWINQKPIPYHHFRVLVTW